MKGKTCVVTGPTAGIGKEIARGLALKNARVALVCRNAAKGEAVAQELRDLAPHADIDLFIADMSVLADVRRVAAELRARYEQLHVLVNNAGEHDPRAAVSAEGFDRMVATNYLGPFLLTHLLLDRLAAGAPARVVMIASVSHRSVLWINPRTFAQPGSYGPVGSMRVYARSKMLGVFFAQEAAKRWRDRGIVVNAVCPGLISTKLATEAPLIGRLFAAAAHTPLVGSPSDGARMPLRVATEPAFEQRTGEIISSVGWMGLAPTTLLRFDAALQKKVWEQSEHLVTLDT